MTTENTSNRSNLIPSFDQFFWPILEHMKEIGGESSRLKIVDAVMAFYMERELSEKEARELRYRIERAFDLLITAEFVEERFGNLFVLSNGALTISRKEAQNLHRHIRKLDNYFSDSDETASYPVERKEVIARSTVKFLKGEGMNEIQLKEKLVKDFIERRDLGKNLKVVNRFLKQADYVKTVLEAEEIVTECEDGTIELAKSQDKAEKILDSHFKENGVASVFPGLNKLVAKVRSDARARYGKSLLKQLALDLTTFMSIVGLAWLFVNKDKKGRI